jgi:hypothetical protein
VAARPAPAGGIVVRRRFSLGGKQNAERIPPLSGFPVFESGAIAQTEQTVGLHRKAVPHCKTCRRNGSVPSTRSVLECGEKRRFGPEYKTSPTKLICAPKCNYLCF